MSSATPRTPEPPMNTVTPPEGPSLASLVNLAVGVVIVAALYFGRDVFIPIVLSILLSFVLAPLVDLLRRFYLPRVPAVVAAVVLALGIVLSLGTVIGLQMATLASDLPRYESTIRAKVASLQEGALGNLADRMRNVGRGIREVAEEKPSTNPPVTPAPAPTAEPEPPKPVQVDVVEKEATPVEIAQRFILPILHPLATVGIVFVIVVFILMQREDLRDRLIRLFGARDLHRTTAAMDDAAQRLSRYYLIQLGLNASFGVFTAAGLWAIGVPSPILWGIFAALMRFVPYVGSILAAAGPVALAAAVDPGWSMVLWTVALFAIGEPLMGHVIEPLVYGQSTGLSPFAVIVSAIFWTWLWGPIGLILATPMTLCLVVLGRHVERLEFLDVLLGDRPALTPAENFYQRMLAGDPDEAEEYAEQLLKERSLSSYYDEVALKGLQLAANDALRGVLPRAQIERMREAVTGLVGDLAEYEDRDPPTKGKGAAEDLAGPTADEKDLANPSAPTPEVPAPNALHEAWAREGAVLCIAGRGPLDEAAATMLAQLLTKHGLGSRVVPHQAVSRSAIMGLDLEGVSMVCISYLEISGNPAHLRYLIRRLRQRAPDLPVLVGLWPSEDRVLKEESIRKLIGADYYVSSLRQGVQACLDAAMARPAEPAPAAPPAQGPTYVEVTRKPVAEKERA
jgi:predicted PurR-regulated permease PerM